MSNLGCSHVAANYKFLIDITCYHKLKISSGQVKSGKVNYFSVEVKAVRY